MTRDSERHAERENERSSVEAEGCQSGGVAASPTPSHLRGSVTSGSTAREPVCARCGGARADLARGRDPEEFCNPCYDDVEADLSHPPVEPTNTIYVRFSDDGKHIQKWSREPFENGEPHLAVEPTDVTDEGGAK